MVRRFLSILVIFAVCQTLLSSPAVTHKSEGQAGAVKIEPTSYLEMVAEKLKQPGVTAEDAAEYANSLLAIHGFEYDFDACPIVKANPHPQPIHDKYGLTKSYNYSFVQTNNR